MKLSVNNERQQHSVPASNVRVPPVTSTTPSRFALPRSKYFVDQQWQRATGMLQSNPSLVTYHILCLALKHRPPTNVIQYMLQLNPKAAGVPKIGPTPLQVALQHSCSTAIVRLLIEACPLALVATNPGSQTDPLAYAKRFRANEKELIALLSQPLSSWVQLSNESDAATQAEAKLVATRALKDSYKTLKETATLSASPTTSSTNTTTQLVSSLFDLATTCATVTTTLTDANAVAAAAASVPVNTAAPTKHSQSFGQFNTTVSPTVTDHRDEELNNVKTLCVMMVKGHKRLSRELKVVHDQQFQISASLRQLQTGSTNPDNMLSRLYCQNQKQLQTQLIALDNKWKDKIGSAQWKADLEASLQQMVCTAVTTALSHEKYNPDHLDTKLDQLKRAVNEQINQLRDHVQQMEDDLLEMPAKRAWTDFYQHREQTSAQRSENTADLFHTTRLYSTAIMDHTITTAGTVTTMTAADHASPILFCTPVPEHIRTDADDEVRSLLSEDELFPSKRRFVVANGPFGRRAVISKQQKHCVMVRWMLLLKDGLFV